ncbi:MAG: hypothetical protein ABEJ56_03110 [Candidatus Nanohaloarchaea archaeon]
MKSKKKLEDYVGSWSMKKGEWKDIEKSLGKIWSQCFFTKNDKIERGK